MKLAVLFSLLGSLSTSAAQEDNSCPVGFTLFEESCYALMNGDETWPDAQHICDSLQAHLAEVYTAQEMQFVQNFTTGHGDVWLGAHDLIREGLWIWAWSGSQFQYSAWDSYSPNNRDGDQNCLELGDHSKMWNDEQCDHQNEFICQKSANVD